LGDRRAAADCSRVRTHKDEGVFMNQRVAKAKARWAGASALLLGSLLAAPAQADVILLEKDGWTAYMNGRMQTFLNFNRGDGIPSYVLDANGNSVTIQGGGMADGIISERRRLPSGAFDLADQGTIQDLRIRTGFVGNVLGFGVKKKLNADTTISGYTAVTVYIDSTQRRKYMPVNPDWRESFMRIEGPWGSVTAGRTLVLFSRGATEITYMYGYKYGLGWPGSVSTLSESGPGAGHVGFGILGNGFGAGIAYATPKMAGAQLTVGIYDANNLPGTGTLERTRWPRAEGEATFDMTLGTLGMFKLFANGAYQKIYEREGWRDQTIAGVGYGARVELGPVHLGLAGHMGKGIGVDFALQPHSSGWINDHPAKPFRPVNGYSAHLQISPTKTFDLMGAAGITQIHRLTEDLVDARDTDMNPATPAANDDPLPLVKDSVGYIPLKHQIGLSGGVTVHLSDNLHLALEYFRALIKWHTPEPASPGMTGPGQNFHVVNAGVTYDF
jgi:hypothetical protein